MGGDQGSAGRDTGGGGGEMSRYRLVVTDIDGTL